MQTLPVVTQRKLIDVKGINGQPVFTYYQQLLSLLQRDAGQPPLSLFFAEPVVNPLKGEITWSTKVSGEVRPFEALSPTEKISVAQRLSANCQRVRALARQISGDGATSASGHGAQALLAMLSTPDALNSVFVVGDQLVIAQWGCMPYGDKSTDFDLDTRFAQAWRPAEKIVATHKAKSDPSKKRSGAGVLPWLILLVLFLLLLAGLTNRQWIGFVTTGASAQEETALRARIEQLWTQIGVKSQSCTPPVVAPPPAAVVIPPPPAEPSTVSSSEIDRRLQANDVTQGKYINVALAWQGQADLDLLVVQPDGVTISMYNDHVRKSPSGGSLDIDANACQKMSGCATRPEPIENISWNEKPGSGRYQVRVNMFSANAALAERKDVPFTVVVSIDGKKNTYEGVVKVSDMVCADRCHSKVPLNVTFFIVP